MYDGWNDKDTPIEKTIQNWKSVCELGNDIGFDTIIIVQPLPITGHRVTTEQELVNSFSNLTYLQKSQQYVDCLRCCCGYRIYPYTNDKTQKENTKVC